MKIDLSAAATALLEELRQDGVAGRTDGPALTRLGGPETTVDEAIEIAYRLAGPRPGSKRKAIDAVRSYLEDGARTAKAMHALQAIARREDVEAARARP